MKILVIGNGAREHAILWSLASARRASSDRKSIRLGKEFSTDLFCAPGNAGTSCLARNLPLDTNNCQAIIAACRELAIGLVIVGPASPLAAGVVDALLEAGILAFGPHRAAARLEFDKIFGRNFAESQGIPCAHTARFDRGDAVALDRFLDENRGKRIVLKKSGLAAGKGVLESDDPSELWAFGKAVLAADGLLAEEYLVGQELSVFGLCSGRDYVLLEPAVSYKKARAGDFGSNTGGMGAVSPAPFADAAIMAKIDREIVAPSFSGIADEGMAYRGVIFFGIMLTDDGPRLLDYNVHFGDPETQSILPRLDGDFNELCATTASGHLTMPIFNASYSCGLVVAAPGYPIDYPKGLPVDLSGLVAAVDAGDPELEANEIPEAAAFTAIKRGSQTGPAALLFHAATGRDTEGRLRTGGGRSFTAVGLGQDWEIARTRAYTIAKNIRFEGAWYRPDIGNGIYGPKDRGG